MVTWGDAKFGGDSHSVADELKSGVTAVFNAGDGLAAACAALKECGKVVTWGDAECGGDSQSVADELKSGVTAVFNTYHAFAALKEGGRVVTWGGAECGGDSQSVAGELKNGVTMVFSTGRAFAALKDCWSDGHLSKLNLKQLKKKVHRLSQDVHFKRIGQETDKAALIATIREFHLLA